MTLDAQEIARAAEKLNAGGVVAFPTETVYGLGADAFNPEAVRRVFTLKGRPRSNPLIVHVADAEAARRCVTYWPLEAEALARAFWPGPLSLVLPKVDTLPHMVTGGGPNVALRSPGHPVALALLQAFGGAMVGPSANLSGSVSPTEAAHVRGVWPESEVLVLDGGRCRVGIESTVLSLAGPAPRVLRPGVVTPQEIAKVLGRGVSFEASPTSDGPLDSPGRLRSHYAPAARALMASGEELAQLIRANPGCVAIVTQADMTGAGVIRLPADAAGYAAGLYDALRRADEQRPSVIVIERPPAGEDERWAAVLDRLSRACAPRADVEEEA